MEINLIPLQPRSKIPSDSWKKFQKEKFQAQISGGGNYACICGEISDNLVVIDIDKTQDENIINKLIPNCLDKTLTVKTGTGGFHIFIRVTKLPNSVKLDHDGIHIDVQAEGKYVVGAGSTHPNGNKYKVISSTLEIFHLDFRTIIKNLEVLGFEAKKTKAGLLATGGIETGNRHSEAVRYANHLLFSVGVTFETLKVEMGRWNESNKPPTPEDEIETICSDCYEYWQRENKKTIAKGIGKDPKDKKVSEWADDLMNQYSFKTINETDEFYYYKDGIYIPDFNFTLIKTELEKDVIDCSDRLVQEVVKTIKRRTFIPREDFDSKPNILNFENGLYNLELNELTPHTPSYLSLVRIPVNYNPDAIPFGFLKFISQVLPPKDIYLILEGFANCLLLDSNYEKVFMLIGGGANGKSTFLKIMCDLLGKKNLCAESIHTLTNNVFATSNLFGKLANIHPDIESHDLENTGILKSLISGDLITAQRKYLPVFTFENKAKFFFSANRFPEVEDQSNAFFRRFIIIDFRKTFLQKPDVFLKDRIVNDPEEMAGIMNILLKLIKPLKERGKFRTHESGDQLRKKWNEKANPVRKFIDKFIHFSVGDHFLQIPKLNQEYRKFCMDNNLIPDSSIKFTRTLEKLHDLKRSSKKIDGVSTQVFLGACLKSDLKHGINNEAQKTLGDQDEE